MVVVRVVGGHHPVIRVVMVVVRVVVGHHPVIRVVMVVMRVVVGHHPVIRVVIVMRVVVRHHPVIRVVIVMVEGSTSREVVIGKLGIVLIQFHIFRFFDSHLLQQSTF